MKYQLFDLRYSAKRRSRMSIEMRVLTCRLLEKMKVREEYGKRLGLEDMSRIHGMRIEKDIKSLKKKG